MSDAIPLYSKRDWDDYRSNLDLPRRHDHYGEPSRFPCVVLSDHHHNDNGADWYVHCFVDQDDLYRLLRKDPERVENLAEGFLMVKVLANTDLNPVGGHLTRGETYQYTLHGDYVLLQKLNSSDRRLVLSQAHFGRLQIEERIALYKLTEV